MQLPTLHYHGNPLCSWIVASGFLIPADAQAAFRSLRLNMMVYALPSQVLLLAIAAGPGHIAVQGAASTASLMFYF